MGVPAPIKPNFAQTSHSRVQPNEMDGELRQEDRNETSKQKSEEVESWLERQQKLSAQSTE